MTFCVGQNVVCIDDSEWGAARAQCYGDEKVPRKGAVYTIREIGADRASGCGVLTFLEIRNPERVYSHPTAGDVFGEPGFGAHCFRPVKTTDISIFTAILNKAPAKQGEPA